MSKYKVLVTDRLINDPEHMSLETEREILEPLGVELLDRPCTNEDELIQNGQGAIGLLVTYAKITRRVMESIKGLKIAAKCGIGYDNIDSKAAAELGVYVTNVPDYCQEEVASQALSLIMDGLRRNAFYSSQMKAGTWIKSIAADKLHRPSSLCAGLVGMGRIAGQVLGYIKPLFGSVSYYDPFVPGVPGATRCGSLEQLFSTCDVISLHLPLSEATRSIVSAKILEATKKGLILVNTSRAGLVDRGALLKALEAGRLSFFGADVGWEEPLDMNCPENRALLSLRNVSITPHMAWYSEESEKELRRKAAMEIARVIRGEKPLHAVG